MSVNEDYVQSGSDSFWELGKYMKTVKRCDNGHNLCHQLRRLMEERSDIERKYSASLQEWTKRWNTYLDKGPEYGTTLGAWRSVLTEADRVAELHTIMAERVMSDVHGSIKVWQKENYHKSMMHFKETKEFEDGFRKAQKPWGKRLNKVVTAKKDYHAACRSEKSTANQENNARGDTTVSQDQLKKLQDKLRKCQQEVEGTRDKYTAAVNDLNGYNPKYIEDMTEVYNKCQDFEQKRLDFFKKTLFSLHACLDLSVEAKYSQIYTNLHTTIGNLDPNQDLKWWSSHNGVDMAMNWPEFEEYSPELQAISKRSKPNLSTSEGGIMITSIKHSREDSYGSYTEQQQQQQPYPPQQESYQGYNDSFGGAANCGSDRPGSEAYDKMLNPFGEDEDETGRSGRSQKAEKENHSSNQADSPVNNGENPFGDTDPDAEDPQSEGWTVRALYDYVKAEDDELDFKCGDIFIQIATEDEMGWCKGRKNGMVGFYPKNYVERV